MLRIFTRVQLTYLGIFVLISAGLWAYEAIFVWPAQKCEAAGAWWNPRDHECDTPLEIWRFTGRTPHLTPPPSAPPAPARPAAVAAGPPAAAAPSRSATPAQSGH